MLLAQWPLSVLMERRVLGHRWKRERWSAVAVLPAGYLFADAAPFNAAPGSLRYVADGLMLELHRDELDGYFENWVAPEPKVFVGWRLRATPQGERAVPVQVSVSYAEGARMLDGGDGADGVPMPPPLHAWLGACLAQHRVPRRPGECGHRAHRDDPAAIEGPTTA